MKLFKLLTLILISILSSTLPIKAASNLNGNVFIPFVAEKFSPLASQRTINIPFINNTNVLALMPSMAILSFGKVTVNDNYADVRIGFNNSELVIYIQIFDRYVWYAPNPLNSPLENWDSIAVTLHTGTSADRPTQETYRFIGEFYDWETENNYIKAFQGNGNGWQQRPITFHTQSGYRGDAPNNNIEDRGWTYTFHIPFTSLGFSSSPAIGSLWRIGLTLYNRDSSTGPSQNPETWPENSDSSIPNSWGQLRFGMPIFITPTIKNLQSTMIREGINNIHVPDGQVGGSSVCGDGLDFWTQWGNTNYMGSTFFNIQNQSDVADWPCFSKYYITFPLNSIPLGKVIESAQLSLHQFGNSDPSIAKPSIIQVFTVGEDWNEATITWNTAPMALENISQTTVNVITTYHWPGDEYLWDVSRAVDQAYRMGAPLRLLLYSADASYSSGKYFTSSKAADWDANSRPALIINWGDPIN